MKRSMFIPVMIVMYAFLVQSCSFIFGLQKATILGGDSWQDPFGVQFGVTHPIVDLNESMSIRADAVISMQGAKWAENDMSGRVDLLYLNAPVVFRYQNIRGLFFEAGLQPGLLLRARDKFEGQSYDYKEYVKALDFSIPLGAGYNINDNIAVGLRVIPGISDINKGDYYTTKDRNFVVAIRGIYTLNKK